MEDSSVDPGDFIRIELVDFGSDASFGGGNDTSGAYTINSSVLTAEEHQRILNIYKECARITEETGILHHVDHIHPISKGGKHHPDNLQILTATENIRKGNKLL